MTPISRESAVAMLRAWENEVNELCRLNWPGVIYEVVIDPADLRVGETISFGHTTYVVVDD